MTALDILTTVKNSASVAADTTLFQEGEPGEAMYSILDGIVKILVGERRIAPASAGSIISEMAMINRQPRSATALAETVYTLVLIDESQVQPLKQQIPGLKVFLNLC